MPTYEYICQKCSHHFDAYQGMNDPRLTKCPKCKGKVQRQIGRGSGIIFKGSGFYATDYKKSSVSPSPDAKETKEKKSESKPEAKADTAKPAKKKDKD